MVWYEFHWNLTTIVSFRLLEQIGG